MKRWFAILCLSTYLISTTELSQLLKFPVLIEHFMEHKQQNTEMSVVDFLTIHYNNHLENHPYNDDYKQDENLPFITSSTLFGVVFVAPKQIGFESVLKTFFINKQKIFVKKELFTDRMLLSSIWQPPRL